MAQLLVRNLEQTVVLALRAKAAADGTSVEEAHRRVLRAFAGQRGQLKKDFKAYLLEFPEGGDESVFERDRNPSRDIDLG